MFVKELTADSDYFLTNSHFASVKYSAGNATYAFEIYGRLIQALIDGHDNVKVQIVKRLNPKLKYFVGTGKEDIEISNIGFVQNTKEALQKEIRNATIVETELELVNLLSDSIVSDVGSGIITTNNYKDFLPIIEQLKIVNSTPRRKNINRADFPKFKQSTLGLFRKSGIYPGRVSDIDFPAKKLGKDSDGLSFATRTPSQRALFKNKDFADYYTGFYFKDTNTKISQSFQRAKAEYQKFVVEINLDLLEHNFAKLTSYENLALRVSLVDDDIEVSTKLFRFKNSILFEEATSGVRRVESTIVIPDPKQVLPDRISVINREKYAVEITVNEFYTADTGQSIEKNRLDIRTLAPLESIELDGSRIYFDQSESRCYAVSANKAIPGIRGVSNVLSMLSPPGTNVPPKINSDFDIQIKPGTTPKTAQILVTGIKSIDERAIIYRQRIGFGEREMIGTVIFGRTSMVDKDIQIGDVYVYTAELQLNAAGGYSKASTGYISLLDGDVARISFSLVGKKTSGTSTSPKNSFKILESISTTASTDLLTAANEAGQAGVFESEIEASKQDTTIISSYLVTRIQKSTNKLEILGVYPANKVLTFGYGKGSQNRFVPSETYEYIVLPRSVVLSSLSYKTVVEETDVGSGKSYKFSYKKWRDSNFERAVVLPTSSEVLRNNLQQAFDNLPPGTGESITFSNEFKEGSISSFTAVSKDNLDCAFLSWRYTGNLVGVLHFVIFANYNGYKAPIGIAIPDQAKGSNVRITYCDKKLGNVAGQIIYSIMPLLRDGRPGNESKGVKVSSTKNYPNRALRR